MRHSRPLPKYLYRGDKDPHNYRQLKATINSGLLLTNLCNGGNGRQIFSRPFGQLLNEHIGIGWDKTHFLSFSADEGTAINYGCHKMEYEELYDLKENWDFAVFTFDTALLIDESIKEIETGIFVAEFPPTCKEFLPTFKVILIDALNYLKNLTNKPYDIKPAIANAVKDKEWLILPASPLGLNGEFTARLDTNCLSHKKVFKLR